MIDQLEDEIDKNLGSLDTSDLEKFVEALEQNRGKYFDSGANGIVDGVLGGEFAITFDNFFVHICDSLKISLRNYMPLFISLLILGIMYGLVVNMTSGFLKKPTMDIIYFVCFGAMVIMIFAIIGELTYKVYNLIKAMTSLMNISFPIMLTLLTAVGGVASVGIYKPLMLALITVISGLITSFILPCFVGSMVLGVVGNLSSNVRLTKLIKFVKSFAEWTLGIVFGVFMSFVAINGIAGVTFSGLATTTAKFALSSYIPILGGYLSDGLDLVLASCVLIKNSMGITILIVLIVLIAVPICEILILMFGIKFVAAVIEPITDKRMSDMLSNIGDNLMPIIISILGIGFLFFVMIMLVVSSGNVGI